MRSRCPHPALLPKAPAARARVRALAQAVACEIHPLNNLRVLRFLVRDLNVSEEQKLSQQKASFKRQRSLAKQLTSSPLTP